MSVLNSKLIIAILYEVLFTNPFLQFKESELSINETNLLYLPCCVQLIIGNQF